MPPTPTSQGVVYRSGNRTEQNFTPRPGKDTTGRPGQAPGLSTFRPYELGPREKVQVIDLTLLQSPLRAFDDDPTEGGTAGHVSIVPVDSAGEVDQALLEEWARSRGSSPAHRLTELVLAAVVQVNLRRQP